MVVIFKLCLECRSEFKSTYFYGIKKYCSFKKFKPQYSLLLFFRFVIEKNFKVLLGTIYFGLLIFGICVLSLDHFNQLEANKVRRHLKTNGSHCTYGIIFFVQFIKKIYFILQYWNMLTNLTKTNKLSSCHLIETICATSLVFYKYLQFQIVKTLLVISRVLYFVAFVITIIIVSFDSFPFSAERTKKTHTH